MESKTFAPTPKDAIAAVMFLRDEVRKGKLAMAPLLKKKLQEIGLFRDGAYRRLIEEGKKAFAARTKAANDEFVHDIETLEAYEANNSEFRAKVKGFLDGISKARGEDQAYARIDSLKAFLEEFGFYSPEFMRKALGVALWEKYRGRSRDERVDETEEQEAQ
ncbi:MAG: hypothetical protein FD180_4641 [Planctomycetota bacterium]|nr:MAG: hypothetical protein FD180_4641 [Planctomycetota bacterium]